MSADWTGADKLRGIKAPKGEGAGLAFGTRKRVNPVLCYTQADMDAMRAADQARIAELGEALTEIEGTSAPDHWVPQFQHCIDIARAALKGSTNE